MPSFDGPRLVVQWDGIGEMSHPLPLPGDFENAWRFVEMLGAVLPEERRRATWFVDTGTRDRGSVVVTSPTTGAPRG